MTFVGNSRHACRVLLLLLLLLALREGISQMWWHARGRVFYLDFFYFHDELVGFVKSGYQQGKMFQEFANTQVRIRAAGKYYVYFYTGRLGASNDPRSRAIGAKLNTISELQAYVNIFGDGVLCASFARISMSASPGGSSDLFFAAFASCFLR